MSFFLCIINEIDLRRFLLSKNSTGEFIPVNYTLVIEIILPRFHSSTTTSLQ